jgi:calcineurin-like phosphoesterase family protein
MKTVFFIGDTHFGHKNIIEYEKTTRNFSSIEEHNEELIKRWNSVVGKNDIVYHLGDFCFGKQNIAIAGRLNGSKRLIMGNHDVYEASDYLKYFDKLYGAHFYKNTILTHVPVHPDHARVLINIHGHLHSRSVIYKPDDSTFYINVSCEHINLTPISLEELKSKFPGLEIPASYKLTE